MVYDFNNSIASLIDGINRENYDFFNKNSRNNIEKFEELISNYLGKILEYKFSDEKTIKDKVAFISKRIIEHLTGDYEIGLGDKTFEELDKDAQSFGIIMGYANNDEIKELESLETNEIADTLVDGNIAYGMIELDENNTKKATNNFSVKHTKLREFFNNSVRNILTINEKMATLIANMAGMNSEKSQGLNDNIAGKLIGGLAYEFLSGTLISKRHFTSIENSNIMKELIEKEGLLHFTSPSNIEKILESGKIKASNFLVSDATREKSFFFAGTPKFEDLLINIPAYDVMTAIRINPNEEQIKELKYRALNDRAVVKDGEFTFFKEQAEVAYFGLQYDKEEARIFLGEISSEEAKTFKVSDEVKKAFSYKPKGNSLVDNLKINAYGFFAEYKHHQSLLRFQEEMRKRGIKDFRDVSEKDLFDMTDLEEASISKKDEELKTSKGKDVLDFVKMTLKGTTISEINTVMGQMVKDFERGLMKKEGMER